MKTDHEHILEKFLGKMDSCKFINKYTDPINKAGVYWFFHVKSKEIPVDGEVCLYETTQKILDPLEECSETSPVFGVENGSGKLAIAYFSTLKDNRATCSVDYMNYCLYRLEP